MEEFTYVASKRCIRCGESMTLEHSPQQDCTFWNCWNCGKQELWPVERESRTGTYILYDLELFLKAKNPDKADLKTIREWLMKHKDPLQGKGARDGRS